MTTSAAPATAAGVMDRLKISTAEHHTRAEARDLQRSLVRGTVTRERFGAFLGQMLLVHEALERALARAAEADARIGVVPPEQRHSGRIREDLPAYGVDTDRLRPLPATAALVQTIESLAEATPMAVLGLHYVLEGSMNGNRYIATALRRSLRLEPGRGDRYLDPYGDLQRAKWLEFRAAVDRLEWTEPEVAAAIEAARAMFDGVAAISDGV